MKTEEQWSEDDGDIEESSFESFDSFAEYERSNYYADTPYRESLRQQQIQGLRLNHDTPIMQNQVEENGLTEDLQIDSDMSASLHNNQLEESQKQEQEWNEYQRLEFIHRLEAAKMAGAPIDPETLELWEQEIYYRHEESDGMQYPYLYPQQENNDLYNIKPNQFDPGMNSDGDETQILEDIEAHFKENANGQYETPSHWCAPSPPPQPYHTTTNNLKVGSFKKKLKLLAKPSTDEFYSNRYSSTAYQQPELHKNETEDNDKDNRVYIAPQFKFPAPSKNSRKGKTRAKFSGKLDKFSNTISNYHQNHIHQRQLRRQISEQTMNPTLPPHSLMLHPHIPEEITMNDHAGSESLLSFAGEYAEAIGGGVSRMHKVYENLNIDYTDDEEKVEENEWGANKYLKKSIFNKLRTNEYEQKRREQK